MSSFTKWFNLFVRYHPSFYSGMVSPKIHFFRNWLFRNPIQNISMHNLCNKVISKMKWYRHMTGLVMTSWLLNRCWLWRNPNDSRDSSDSTVVLQYYLCLLCSLIKPSESSNIIFEARWNSGLIVPELWQNHTGWTWGWKPCHFYILIAIRWIFVNIDIYIYIFIYKLYYIYIHFYLKYIQIAAKYNDTLGIEYS